MSSEPGSDRTFTFAYSKTSSISSSVPSLTFNGIDNRSVSVFSAGGVLRSSALPSACISVAVYLYDMSLAWEQQSPDVDRPVIPSFVCPSDSIPNLVTEPFPAVQMFAIGDTLGTTTYLYCRGASHFWCLNPQSIPASVRGMFDRNAVVRIRDVTDGSTNTFAMGEGAAGASYRICK